MVAVDLVRLLYIFIAQIALSYQDDFAGQGPYEILWTDIDHCEDTGSNLITFKDQQLKKVGPNKYKVAYVLVNGIPLGDNLGGKLVIAKKVDGEWKKNFYVDEFPQFCAFLKNMIPSAMEKVFKNVGYEDCPFPKGELVFSEMDVDVTFSLPTLPYGEYKMDMVVLDGVTTVGCFEFTISIVPKAKRRRRKGNAKAVTSSLDDENSFMY